MSFWNHLTDADKQQIQPYLEDVHFDEDTCIFEEEDPAEGCYIILKGTVRLEIQHSETESDNVLGHLEAGQLLGEFSLIEPSHRSASAYSETPLDAQWLSTDRFHELCNEQPELGLEISNALVNELTEKLKNQNEVLAGYMFDDAIDASTDTMVQKACDAYPALQSWSEERLDSMLEDIAQTIWDRADEYARQTVELTKIGRPEDKKQKIYFASVQVYDRIKNRSSSGFLEQSTYENGQNGIRDIGDAAGVVLGLIPITNPIPTIVYKTLIALKARNSIIISSHRRALPVANSAVDAIRDVLTSHGAPADLVQTIRKRTSRKKTMMFMKHPDVSLILATGGPSMVKAAYSSGTPAIGVGPGNAPVWIAEDADIQQSAEDIVNSKSFDNGVICGSENNLIVDASVKDELLDALEYKGVKILNDSEKQTALNQWFDSSSHHINKQFIGQHPQKLGDCLSALEDSDTSPDLFIIPADANEADGPLGREKLAPVLSLFTVSSDNEATQLCRKLLTNEGEGHTAVVHTNSTKRAEQFGLDMPASRVLVNAPSSQGCIGIGTGLFPAFTLGCGTYGGNSTTDNVNFKNLMNVKRLASNREPAMP